MEPDAREPVLQQLIDTVSDFYQRQDFAHDRAHALRVVRFASLLQEREGGDVFLVQAGAWLHQLHDELPLLDELLADLAIEKQLSEQLREIVCLCRPHRISETSPLEARIVFDADALEVLGPYGSIREVLCNCLSRGLSWKEAVHSAREVQEEFLSKLTTATAKELAGEACSINQQFWQCYDQWERQTDFNLEQARER